MSLGVPMGFTNSQAYELSADGSVIVGTAQGTGTIEKQAFRYTDELGIDLLDLLPDWRYSTARGVSDDGSIVIGFAQVADGSGYDIFRWTADGEYEVLPPPPELPTFDTDFLYASADAAVIVATSAGRPLIWRSGHGTRYVDEVLADDFGLADEIEGWQLSGEVGDIHVSADGTVIAGAGVNPSGIREPWVAILNPTGDFNRDGVLGVSDADLLVGQIVGGDHDTRFDLSNDDLVDNTDLRQWLSIAGIENGFKSGYLIGDANLDGTVNASDLNKVGLHWFQDPARWSAGDFTADGFVNVDDLNHVGQNWLQSVPSANAASAVPEPMTHLLIASAAVCLILVRRGPGT